jgi:hypothetical protein
MPSSGGSVMPASGGTPAPFISGDLTGTGAAQNIPHGLGQVPSKVLAIPVDLSPATIGQYTWTEGVHTATNIVVTVTNGKKYRVMAWP